MNRQSITSHASVNERLKFVDILVMRGSIGDAIKEVAEIRRLDPTNAYAQAYEERLQTIKQSTNPQDIVGERLKFVDVLVKRGSIADALKEIAEIRILEPRDPSVRAYEKRIQAMKLAINAQSELSAEHCSADMGSDHRVPASSEIVPEGFPHNFELDGSGQLDEFLRSVERMVPTANDSSAGGLPANGRTSCGKGSILLVDDDELLLRALVELFEDNKYTTKYFTKSDDALEYLRGHKPDLVLCDVSLTNSSFGGFTLLERMAKLGHLQNVPFVFMSGLNDEAIIRAGKELGADDYLTKPFEPDMLLSVVKGKLKKYKQRQVNH